MNKIRDEYRIVGKNFLHIKTGRVYQVVNLAYRESDLVVIKFSFPKAKLFATKSKI